MNGMRCTGTLYNKHCKHKITESRKGQTIALTHTHTITCALELLAWGFVHFCTYISAKYVYRVLRGEESSESTAVKMVTGHRDTETLNSRGYRSEICTVVRYDQRST